MRNAFNGSAARTMAPRDPQLQLVRMVAPVRIGGANIAANTNFAIDPDGRIYLDRNDGKGPVMLSGGYTTADVHDPTEMATYLAGYSQAEYRHDDACQIIPVDKDSDKYRTFNSSVAFRPAKVKTTDYSTPTEVSQETSLTNYNVIARRVATFVPDSVQAQAGANWNVITTSLAQLRNLIDLDLEIDVLGLGGLLTTYTNWSSGLAPLLAAGFQWGGASGIGASSDPIKDLQAMQEASAQPIRKFAMNERVKNTFLRHSAVREHLRSIMGDATLPRAISETARVAPAAVSDFEIPGIGSFMVCMAKADQGGAAPDYIMPDVVVGLTQPNGRPTNGQQIASAYNFRVVNNENGNTGFGIRQFRVENRGAAGTMIIVEEKSIPTMTSSIAGGMIRGVLA